MANLWIDKHENRKFVIPYDFTLCAGSLRLTATDGREINVDPESVAAFEVSEEEAKAWLKEQLGDVAKQLKAGLRDALFGSKSATAEPTVAPDPAVSEGDPPSKTPGLDLLAAITDTPRESLTGDYAAIGQAVRAYLQDVTATAGDAVSGDPQRVRAARERMRDWDETLRAHGVAAPDAPDPPDAPSKPPSPAPTPEPSPDDSSTAYEPGSLAARLHNLAEEFRRRADTIAAEREAAERSSDADGGPPPKNDKAAS